MWKQLLGVAGPEMWKQLLGVALMSLVATTATGAGEKSEPEYPQRAVRLIVGFPPGGTDDYLARLLGPKLSERLGQSFIVENRAGATANIAADLVAHAPPDGYALFFGPTSLLAAGRSLYPKLGYDLLKDFEFVSLIGTGPTVLLANPSLPAKSLDALIAQARAQPNEIRYGSGGIGSLAHLAMELLQSRANVRLSHVPYKGAAPNAMALTAGEIGVSFAGVSSSLSMVNAKRLNALAVSGPRRVASLPDVPTIAESGYPGFNVSNTYGLLAPTGTPAHVIRILGAAISETLQSQDIRSKFDAQGIEPMGNPPSIYRATTEEEVSTWAKVVKDAGIKAE